MFLLNCLLRGCIFGLSGPLVSQMVGGAMAPLAPPPGSYAYGHEEHCDSTKKVVHTILFQCVSPSPNGVPK